MKLRRKNQLRGEGEAHCPLCRVLLGAPDDEELPCEDCGTRMHLDCAHELGGCPTLGCGRKGIAPGGLGTPLPISVPTAPLLDGTVPGSLVDDALAGLRRRMQAEDPDYEPPSEEEMDVIRQRLAHLHERRWQSPVGLSQMVLGDGEDANGCLLVGLGLVIGGAAIMQTNGEAAMWMFVGGFSSIILAALFTWARR